MNIERALHLAWRRAAWLSLSFVSSCGKHIRLVSAGSENIHAGPDFLHARIYINGRLWVGNVEIHRKAADWYRHGHHRNPAFDNVILHVVARSGPLTLNSKQRPIPTIELPTGLQGFPEADDPPFRAPSCGITKHAGTRSSLAKLGEERLRQRSQTISSSWHLPESDWNTRLYQSLASGFGQPVNSLPFEWLALRTPFTLLHKYLPNRFDIEALLYGQAGMLGRLPSARGYPLQLQKRYEEIGHSLQYEALPEHLWKYLRLRPKVFPCIRISQFADLLCKQRPGLRDLLSIRTLPQLEALLFCKASPYWHTHFRFQRPSVYLPKKMGLASIHMVIINAIAPFLLCYGKQTRNPKFEALALQLLLEIEAEQNHITKKWTKFDCQPVNALESQGILQLHQVYCEQHKCSLCPIQAE
ncbi:MAG: hypothetical protein CSA96_00655 [Bacteroidetes bacterium]|nr:MAG: hypothetical protein CSA96_00655 [Bacteroidota bacterium]